jgi:hypothetical protein
MIFPLLWTRAVPAESPPPPKSMTPWPLPLKLLIEITGQSDRGGNHPAEMAAVRHVISAERLTHMRRTYPTGCGMKISPPPVRGVRLARKRLATRAPHASRPMTPPGDAIRDEAGFNPSPSGSERPPGKEEVGDACTAREPTDDAARRCDPGRRGRDSNPRTTKPPLTVFETAPFNHSGTPPRAPEG